MTIHSNKQFFQLLALALCVFALVGMVMLSTTSVAFCEDELLEDGTGDVAENIETAFSKITEKIYKIMRAVIVPCCIVALAFAGFQFLVGGNQGAEKARKVVIGVALAVCFVVFAPMVMNSIATMVGTGNGDGAWDKYNPL